MEVTGSTEEVRWQEEPSADKPKRYDILSPRTGEQVGGLCLSERVLGVITHWIDGRTMPCVKVLSYCEGCSRKLPSRWKGYLAIMKPVDGKYAILELTEEARRSCPDLGPDKWSLRGKRILLTRRGTSKRAAVTATILAGEAQKCLPEGFNLKEALMRIWRGGWEKGDQGPWKPVY
jgi:hypothetical protein